MKNQGTDDYLLTFEKQNIQILLQVITYWINEEEYHIDFSLWKGNGI